MDLGSVYLSVAGLVVIIGLAWAFSGNKRRAQMLPGYDVSVPVAMTAFIILAAAFWPVTLLLIVIVGIRRLTKRTTHGTSRRARSRRKKSRLA